LRTLGASSVEKTTTDIKAQGTNSDTHKKVIENSAEIKQESATSDFVMKKPAVVMAGEVCESCQ
jgi:hypothetical protein